MVRKTMNLMPILFLVLAIVAMIVNIFLFAQGGGFRPSGLAVRGILLLVAIGCVAEARLAVRFGLAPAAWPDAFAARFRAAGLPTELPAGLSEADLVPVMAGDKKKAKGGIVTFARPCGWGDVRAVPLSLARGAVERA